MSLHQLTRRGLLCRGTIGVLAFALGARDGGSRVFSADQVASADLITRQASPYNAEPPLPRLIVGSNWTAAN